LQSKILESMHYAAPDSPVTSFAQISPMPTLGFRLGSSVKYVLYFGTTHLSFMSSLHLNVYQMITF